MQSIDVTNVLGGTFEIEFAKMSPCVFTEAAAKPKVLRTAEMG